MRKSTLFTFLLSIGLSLAGTSQSIVQLRSNTFWAGIPDAEFEQIQAISVNGGKQVQSNWCWAACIQMVLNYHGLQIDQYQIIKKVFGPGLPNQPADEEQIKRALTGWAPHATGYFSSVHAESGKISVYQTIQALAYKWPLIVGIQGAQGGHALVLTGVYYRADEDGRLMPQRVELRDPSPFSGRKVELTWDQFSQRCRTAIKVFVNHRDRMSVAGQD